MAKKKTTVAKSVKTSAKTSTKTKTKTSVAAIVGQKMDKIIKNSTK